MAIQYEARGSNQRASMTRGEKWDWMNNPFDETRTQWTKNPDDPLEQLRRTC